MRSRVGGAMQRRVRRLDVHATNAPPSAEEHRLPRSAARAAPTQQSAGRIGHRIAFRASRGRDREAGPRIARCRRQSRGWFARGAASAGSLFSDACVNRRSAWIARAVGHDGLRRQQRARRLIHERHELVGKARHRAADADAADVRAAADARHPAALADVALHDRAPASQLDDAERRAVFVGELRLLVVAAAVAAFVHRLPEQPRRPQRLVRAESSARGPPPCGGDKAASPSCCRAASGIPERRRSEYPPSTSTSSPDNRASPCSRSDCLPSRGSRRRSRRCRRR